MKLYIFIISYPDTRILIFLKIQYLYTVLVPYWILLPISAQHSLKVTECGYWVVYPWLSSLDTIQ